MAAVHLFGLRLELSNQLIRPPASAGINVRRWSGTLSATGEARISAWLEIGDAHTIEVVLTVAMAERTAGEWFPRDGEQPQGGTTVVRIWDQLFHDLPDAPALLIQTGSLRLEEPGFPARGVSGAEGELRFQVPRSDLVLGLDLPLSLSARREGRFSLDLDASRLLFRSGSFRAIASAPLTNDQGETTGFFRHGHGSLDLAVPLTAVAGAVDLLFEPLEAAAGLLPLHVDVADRTRPIARSNPLETPLAATGHRLGLRVERPAGRPARLARAWLAPASSALSLHSFGLRDARNEALVWGTQSEIDLHLRAGTFARPATLLLAPVYLRTGPEAAFRRSVAGPVHGMVAESQFELAGACRLVCERRVMNLQPVPDDVATGIVSEITAPWLELRDAGGGGQRFARSKPGAAYRDAAPEVTTFRFQGERVGLPLIPDRFFPGAEGADLRNRTHDDLNLVFAGLRDRVVETRHESDLVERPASGGEGSELRPRRVFLPPAPEPRLEIEPYTIVRDYGPIKVRQRIEPGPPPDYVVLRVGRDEFVDSVFNFQLDPNRTDFRLGGPPTAAAGRPVGLVKLSRTLDLAEILRREPDLPREVPGLPGKPLVDVVESQIRSREWVGLLLFSPPLGFSEFKILKDLLGNEALSLAYLAINPPKPGTGFFSLAGRVLWRNPTPAEPPANPERDDETTFRINELDVAWYDSRLTFFHMDADLRFKSFFALPHSTPEGVLLKILGSFDRAKGEIRFLGQLSRSLPLLPSDLDYGPLQQVYVRGAEIKVVEGETAVALDGSLVPRSFGFGGIDWFGRDEGVRIDFEGLQIRIPTAVSSAIRWLKMRYPSLQIRFDGPQFRFGPLALRLNSLGVDWEGVFDWRRLVILRDFPDLGRAFLVGLRLELMKLPELSALSFGRLSFDFTAGLGLNPQGRWDPGFARFGLNAFSFEKLRLQLLRFLELSAERAELIRQTVDGREVPWLHLGGISLSILDRRILERMELFVFSARSQSGLITFLPNATDLGFLKVHWFLAAQNVELERALAERLLSVDSPTLAQEHEDIRQAISTSVAERRFLPGSGGSPAGDWIFAAGFDFFHGIVVGKMLFQENAYYGLALRGGVLKQWFGLDVAVSVLYVKGNRAAEDAFVVSVRVPGIQLPAFEFMGGAILVEIAMNGGFLVDVGFPWLAPGGGRRWDRAFGALIGQWQGMGGFYLRKSHLGLPGGEVLRLAGGYAAEFGLGASFGGGVFRVSVKVGIYGILEGDFYLCDGTVRGLVLVGAVGLLVQGSGELNWWIISVRVEVVISAEARTTLLWGELPNGDRLLPVAGGRAQLRVDFEVYARASAEACIGSGWFKVCKGISVSIPMRFSYSLEL